MFAVGDSVVYPMHGGAIIDSIQAREHNGEWIDFYILNMIFENMTVAIPVKSAEMLGLRNVVSPSTLVEVEKLLKETPDVQSVKSISWNRRFQLYMERIKTGDIFKVAVVFKILSILEGMKKISVGERRLLHNTKQILQSEVMLVKGVDAATAEAWLKNALGE